MHTWFPVRSLLPILAFTIVICVLAGFHIDMAEGAVGDTDVPQRIPQEEEGKERSAESGLSSVLLSTTTTSKAIHSRTPIHLLRCPRSRFDPVKQYKPARMVFTIPVRMCTEVDAETGACTQEYDSWSTAVARVPYLPTHAQQLTEMTLERFGSTDPHAWEIYHTVDNLTYTEQCQTERHFWPIPEVSNELNSIDDKLVKMAQVWAMSHEDKSLVMRWDYGRMWRVPEQMWNAGERALQSGVGIEQVTQPDSFYHQYDLRPIYYA
jgi:hypothetical protein